jgi:hypothetical protein
MKQLMTLGRLVSLEVYDPDTGKTKKRSFRGKWLCTDASGKQLLICVVKRKASQGLSPAVKQRHQRFHNAAPKGAWEGEHPDQVGKLQQIGLVKALTYSVPQSKIKSPEKNPYHWHHAFGDTGHKGGKYPVKVYPQLLEDEAGNLFIRRRSGNIFRTTDWIRG